MTVSDDGLEIADQVEAFEEDTQMLDYTFFAADSPTILLFTRSAKPSPSTSPAASRTSPTRST